MTAAETSFPAGNPDERELLLSWLGYLRGVVVRDLSGVSDADARWRPQGHLLPLLGVVNHLTRVEWRWIEGGMLGQAVSRSEEEFFPGADLSVAAALAAYRRQASQTDEAARTLPLDAPCALRAAR